MSKPVGVVDNNLKVCRAPEPEELEANQSSSNLEFVYEDSDSFNPALVSPQASLPKVNSLWNWESLKKDLIESYLALGDLKATGRAAEIKSKILSFSRLQQRSCLSCLRRMQSNAIAPFSSPLGIKN
jgi:hypothetical protein